MIHEYDRHSDGHAKMTRHVRFPTSFSPSGRSEARPECTSGKMIPNASVTRCEFPPAARSSAATKSSPYPVAG